MEASAQPVSGAGPRGGARLLPPRLLRLASDERLVGMVRAGSEPAFEVLYDRHHRGILGFCRHMLGSREEAEDAVQHTFMSAYRSLLGSDQDMQLRAWLYAIARNRCLSVLRARRERPSDDLDEPATDGLADQVERRAELKELLADLSGLPDDQRAALVLSELGDLPHDEIGTVLGCPREKVKALVFQARSSLQQSRQARETSCEEIRELLSTLSGGALRRVALRRHVAACPGCRDFEVEVKRQRRAMAVVLPVIPTLGLKESALAAAFGAKGAAAGAGTAAAGTLAAHAAGVGSAAGGVAAAGGTSALVAKVLAVAAVASGGSVAGYQAVSSSGADGAAAPPPKSAPAVPAADDSTAQETGKPAEPGERRSDEARRRGHDDRGKTWAERRGKGRKHGLKGTQPRTAGKERAAERRRQAEERRAAARSRGRAPAKPPRATGPAAPKAKAKVRPAPKPKPQARKAPAKKAPAQQPSPQSTPVPTPEATPVPEATAAPETGAGRGGERSAGRG